MRWRVSFSITLGYHRLFSHASFRAAWPVRLLVLIFGGAAFEQSAMRWSALHRRHHRYTDTNRDPYNIKRGFFYAHVGWILFETPVVDYSTVRDLARDPLILHQHRHYKLWSQLFGLVVPLLVGAWIGGWAYAILFPVAARIFLVLNAAFFINSVAHTFGDQPFDSEHFRARPLACRTSYQWRRLSQFSSSFPEGLSKRCSLVPLGSDQVADLGFIACRTDFGAQQNAGRNAGAACKKLGVRREGMRRGCREPPAFRTIQPRSEPPSIASHRSTGACRPSTSASSHVALKSLPSLATSSTIRSRAMRRRKR